MLNQLIIGTEIAFAAALLAPVVQTVIWVLSPIWFQLTLVATIPDLGPELEPKAIAAHIERAINQPVPPVAASIVEPVDAHIERPQQAAPGDDLHIEVVNYPDMKVPALRQECAAKGITWRNVHGKNAHLKKGEMVAALEAL